MADSQVARSSTFLVVAFRVLEEDLVVDEMDFPMTLGGRHAYLRVLISVHNLGVGVEAEVTSEFLAAVRSYLQEYLELVECKFIRFLEVHLSQVVLPEHQRLHVSSL